MARYAILIFLILFLNCASRLKNEKAPLNNRDFMETCLKRTLRDQLQFPAELKNIRLNPVSPNPYNFLVHSVLSNMAKSMNKSIWKSSQPNEAVLDFEVQFIGVSFEKASANFLLQAEILERKAKFVLSAKLYSKGGKELFNRHFTGVLKDSIYYDQIKTVQVSPPLYNGPYSRDRNILWEGVFMIGAILTSIYLFYVDKNPD